MAIERNGAYHIAFGLVTKAIESGAVKLRGPEMKNTAASDGTADAAYLIALIRGLQAELPQD